MSRTPDTAEDSKPTAELPLLLRPVAALQPGISAAERSRSLYFRCKKQQKQLGASVGPAHRPAARAALEVAGCTLKDYYFALGLADVIVVYEAPDAINDDPRSLGRIFISGEPRAGKPKGLLAIFPTTWFGFSFGNVIRRSRRWSVWG